MKYLVLAIVLCFGIAWSIYFYEHMDTLCQHWWIRATKECIGYNVSRR